MASQQPSHLLQLDESTRRLLWDHLKEIIERYQNDVDNHRVTPLLEPSKIRAALSALDFKKSIDPLQAVDFIASQLWENQVHTPHARYYGLFNPAPTTMGIAGDMLAAAFNPQLAAWSHSPFAVEAEQHLIRSFGHLFGYPQSETDGTFTSGGAEANHTALLTALVNSFPALGTSGVQSLPKQPVFYVSAESHHSFLKAASISGIGKESVRIVPVDNQLKINIDILQNTITADRKNGFAPFLLVGTAGTTSAGVIDPLEHLVRIAKEEELWFHVDAAWGGGAVFVTELRYLLNGCSSADSITFDAHKWLSVPMGAGIYLTRHRDILEKTFHISTSYMPRDAEGLTVIDPYHHSIQWSRRFIGLKVLLSLMVAGWDGYAESIRNMIRLGDQLRKSLVRSGWKLVNDSPLPVVCFVDASSPDIIIPEKVVQNIILRGNTWISSVVLGGSTQAIRACITNYRTADKDITALVEELNTVREIVRRG
jgi:glutamate/tyrosine decarboxylase-like PLP-dependent enzyme